MFRLLKHNDELDIKTLTLLERTAPFPPPPRWLRPCGDGGVLRFKVDVLTKDGTFYARPAGTFCGPGPGPQQIFIFRPALGPNYKIRIFKASLNKITIFTIMQIIILTINFSLYNK